ncbi:glycosyltransferase [Streptomyces somaliensis]|uniref:glycosyltransferase n=1 Tax=Streptomyces somaliensis TaxID=78355 RepID=UPI0034E9467B|nr:glycosyltransferase [Streptomyces somaliensis]
MPQGAEVTIAALSRLPDTELVVVGGPPPAPDSTPTRRYGGCAGRPGAGSDRVVHRGGVRDEVALPPRGADVVVCPGDYEPFGIVPLEAMACGRPVVATAVGGQLDTVADPECGRLVPPDPAALARAAAELLADPGLRAACGAAVPRRRVLSRYGWERVGAATEAVYARVLAARPAVTGAA